MKLLNFNQKVSNLNTHFFAAFCDPDGDNEFANGWNDSFGRNFSTYSPNTELKAIMDIYDINYCSITLHTDSFQVIRSLRNFNGFGTGNVRIYTCDKYLQNIEEIGYIYSQETLDDYLERYCKESEND